MAMAVMETIPDWRNCDIRILATDINSRSLKLARDGAYDSWKVRVTEKHYLGKYFKCVGNKYVVRDEVKSLVHFAHLNLQTEIKAPQPLLTESFDAIFCRNVMIYFTTTTNSKIVEGFASHLKPGGYLFLGHSETLAGISTKFDSQIYDGGFFYRKKSAEEPAKINAAAKAPDITHAKVLANCERPLKLLKKAVPPLETNENIHACYEKAVARMNEKNPVKRENLFSKILEEKPDHMAAFLGEALISAHEGKLNEALTYCNMALLIDDLLPEAYFFRGLVFEMFAFTEDSLREYGKAILLNSDFVMPYYKLGKLCALTRQHKLGSRQLQNCMKLMAKIDRDTVIPYSGGITREVFLEQLREELKHIEGAGVTRAFR
jgi:chemotaxis protein methyltransferase CheR